MYLSRREKEMIGALIGLVALLGTGIGIGTVETINYVKETSSTMSAEAGFEVVDVQEAELSQLNNDFKATIKCTHKQTNQPIIIEYKLTATDFIVMNQKDSSPWDYLSMYIIPHQDPSFVGTTAEYKAYKANSTQTENQPIK